MMAPNSVCVQDRSQQAALPSSRAEKNGHKSLSSKYKNFTLGYKTAAFQWWAKTPLAKAEHNVLSFIPYIQRPQTLIQNGPASVLSHPSTTSVTTEPLRAATPVTPNLVTDPHGPRAWYLNRIHLSGKNRALNEFSVERVNEDVEENLVMLPGYGAGLALFYKNFEGLSQAKGWKIYALDMLGMGRSSRPHFKIHAKDQAGKITEAENWLIDALEEWRILKKIDRFTLLGHSMGGYMAVAYTLKYPGHLKKLILVSPVGIPEDPYSKKASNQATKESTMANEFTQSPKYRHLPFPKLLAYLWNAKFTPFDIVRWSGPLGPRLMSGWSSRRFSHLPYDEFEALHLYTYALFTQPASGEYALSYILAPGAFARSPLIHRIHGVGRQVIPTSYVRGSGQGANECVKETGIPVVFMYGDKDWMDEDGGYAAKQKLEEERQQHLKVASPEERSRENGQAKVLIVKNSGHHVYLDGWEEFNKMIREEMRDVASRSQLEKEKGW